MRTSKDERVCGYREGEHDACIQSDADGTWAPSGAHDASVERRKRAWAPKQELERAKARGVKHRRVPRMDRDAERRLMHASANMNAARRFTNACIDGIARCRGCTRNVSAAAAEHRRRKCPSAVRRANMEGFDERLRLFTNVERARASQGERDSIRASEQREACADAGTPFIAR